MLKALEQKLVYCELYRDMLLHCHDGTAIAALGGLLKGMLNGVRHVTRTIEDVTLLRPV